MQAAPLTHSSSSQQAHQPILEQLHLSGNQLTCVQPPPDAGAFRTLRTLLLAGNRIADWCAPTAVSRS
jgi:hypothetical protein